MAITDPKTGRVNEGLVSGSVPFEEKGAALVTARKPFEAPPLQRLDSGFVRGVFDVLSGSKTEKKGEKLPPAEPRGILPGGTGSAADPSVTKRATGGGIASPLKEGTLENPETLQRTYYGPRTVLSMDGMMGFEYVPVKTIKYMDAALAVVEVRFADDPE